MNSVALLPSMFNPKVLRATSFRSLGLTDFKNRQNSTKANLNISNRLLGKVAVTTASTDGIGYAIVERLSAEGAQVVISSRKIENVEAAVRKLKEQGHSVIGLTCHVSKEEERERLINKTLETFGGIDILVSNAAVNPGFGGALECPGDVWDKIFEVNVKNMLQLTSLVVPHMKKRNGGSVVYISSLGGYRPYPPLGPYTVSKTTLFGLTRAVAEEVAEDNIRVNCVAPGLIKTKFGAIIYKNKDMMKHVMNVTPMKRLGEPEELSGIVAMLCSSDASYITGESIAVGGGIRCRL